ncbi:MAG: M48 family metalloprotease [Rhodobacter sp.]|nr:M48 family metalloprotease [Rhodobacter sp.]
MAGNLARGARAALAALLLLCIALPAQAITLIRDPDIEYSLRKLAAPVLTAAGLSPGNIRVLIVRDDKLNAFVVDSRHILIHSGLLLRMNRAEELQAVLAHEAAHIANGHITRRLSNQRVASNAAKFGLLLSLAAGAATGNAEAAAGIALGTSSSAQRLFFAHTRAEEASADQAALRYMAMRGIDPTAMNDVLDLFRGQELLTPGRQDPYVRTHPLTRDRIRAVKGYVAAYKNRTKDDPTADYWFLRAKGKLGAFLRNPGWTLRRIDKNDTSDIARMRRAVAYHRIPDRARAVAEINRLAVQRPGDPYILDLKGQILLESKDFRGAVAAYGAAVNAAPNEPLILAGYGRALLALKTADGNRRALNALERARSRDTQDPRMMRDLAVAYAKTGNNGMASLATAERYALLGNLETAAVHAKRAEGLLPRGSPGWNRAQDVLNAARSAGKRRK